MTETQDERYTRYLLYNKGIWFASCPEMEVWAERKVSEGILKPLSQLIPGTTSKNWYISTEITKTEQLLVYFTEQGLYDLFGVYTHWLDYQI